MNKNVKDNNNQSFDSAILDQKFHKIDNIDFLPEREKPDSYNKLFYKNLEEIKIIDLPIDQEKKLFYHFETNANASLTSTVSQITITSEQLAQSNIDTYNEIKFLEKEIEELKKGIEIADTQFYELYCPEIKRIKIIIQNFLVEQKTENFKLIKELAVLEKEKIDTNIKVIDALAKLIKVENEVGVLPTSFSHQLDSMIENKIVFEDHMH